MIVSTNTFLGHSRIKSTARCKHYLELSMKYIKENGGAIIYFQPDGQGTSIAHDVAASVLGNHGSGATLDLRADAECNLVASSLDDMGVESIRLLSHSSAKVRRLRGLGVDVRGIVPLGRAD